MGAGLRVHPGQRRQAVLDGGAHQLVVGGVEVHLIDALPIAIMGAQHRLVLVGEETGDHQRPAGQRAVGVQPRVAPTTVEAAHPFLQRQVQAVEVGAIQRRHLVEHLMGFGELMQVHRGLR